MTKPILYIQQALREEQFEQILNRASAYDVRHGPESIDESELDQIEMMFRWNRDLGWFC